MNPWIYVALAVVGEVIGTASLRAAEGFTRPLPSVAVIAGYGGAFWLMSFAVQSLPIGTAYAAWAGCGTALAAMLGWTFFSDPINWQSVLGIALVVLGVLFLNFSGAK